MKLAGAYIPRRWIESRRIVDAAPLLPVALITGLVVIQTLADGRRLTIDARVPGIMAAAVAIRLRAPLIAVVIVGAGVTALVRAA